MNGLVGGTIESAYRFSLLPSLPSPVHSVPHTGCRATLLKQKSGRVGPLLKTWHVSPSHSEASEATHYISSPLASLISTLIITHSLIHSALARFMPQGLCTGCSPSKNQLLQIPAWLSHLLQVFALLLPSE